VLEQNINNDRRVQTQVLNLSTLVSGRIQAFRPFPASFGQSEAEQFHEPADPKEENQHKHF